MSEAALELRAVARTYRSGETDLHILRGADLALHPGEITALVAPSGTGKSTLLHLAGLLERPDAGQVLVAGKDAGTQDDAARTAIRRDSIGFVFQFHHLLPEFSVRENILMPMRISGGSGAGIKSHVEHLVAMLGLQGLEDKNANALSGGQKQRVAIARALVNRPALVLADEPTGNLDSVNTRAVYELFRQLNRELGTAFIIVTHDRAVAQQTDRILEVKDGRLVQDVRNTYLEAGAPV